MPLSTTPDQPLLRSVPTTPSSHQCPRREIAACCAPCYSSRPHLCPSYLEFLDFYAPPCVDFFYLYAPTYSSRPAALALCSHHSIPTSRLKALGLAGLGAQSAQYPGKMTKTPETVQKKSAHCWTLRTLGENLTDISSTTQGRLQPIPTLSAAMETVQYSPAQYSTVQYMTVQYSTV